MKKSLGINLTWSIPFLVAALILGLTGMVDWWIIILIALLGLSFKIEKVK